MTMNEDDLRDCFAMFALCGLIMRGNNHPVVSLPREAYQFADAMLEARKHNIEVNDDEEDDGGITTVAPKRTRRKSR